MTNGKETPQTRMDAQYKLEMEPGTLTVFPGADCAVSIIGRDGLVATILTGTGELVVKLNQNEVTLWQHVFTYALPQTPRHEEQGHQPPPPHVDGNGSGPTLERRKPRGRPKGSSRVPKPGQMMNLDGELIQT